ncbi:hypothetical protein SEA_OLGASCLOVER_73 [Gordonia phage OlgasClover]|nr:hypothetical protein SEA_OLGASCLOVER_73 [Gordonia phage OlgasClover]
MDRKREAHARLAELVEELTDIYYQEHLEEEVFRSEHPVCWVLVVGYDSFPEDPEVMGSDGPIIMFPKDDRQPGWKLSGMLGDALNSLSEPE